MYSEDSLFDILNEFDANSLKDKDIDSDDLDLQKKRYENQRYEEDTKSRKNLAYWAATLVSIYLIIVFIILICNGMDCIYLSDVVLSVLLGTTTFNVLGLMYIVLKGYFNIK